MSYRGRPQPAKGSPPVAPARRSPDDDRLRRAVASRTGLTNEEAARLTGRTIAQLVTQADALIDARDAYDGGGTDLDDILADGSATWARETVSGKAFAAEALRDHARGGDLDTQRALAALRGPKRTPRADEDPDERSDRIAARLDAALGRD